MFSFERYDWVEYIEEPSPLDLTSNESEGQ